MLSNDCKIVYLVIIILYRNSKEEEKYVETNDIFKRFSGRKWHDRKIERCLESLLDMGHIQRIEEGKYVPREPLRDYLKTRQEEYIIKIAKYCAEKGKYELYGDTGTDHNKLFKLFSESISIYGLPRFDELTDYEKDILRVLLFRIDDIFTDMELLKKSIEKRIITNKEQKIPYLSLVTLEYWLAKALHETWGNHISRGGRNALFTSYMVKIIELCRENDLYYGRVYKEDGEFITNVFETFLRYEHKHSIPDKPDSFESEESDNIADVPLKKEERLAVIITPPLSKSMDYEESIIDSLNEILEIIINSEQKTHLDSWLMDYIRTKDNLLNNLPSTERDMAHLIVKGANWLKERDKPELTPDDIS